MITNIESVAKSAPLAVARLVFAVLLIVGSAFPCGSRRNRPKAWSLLSARGPSCWLMRPKASSPARRYGSAYSWPTSPKWHTYWKNSGDSGLPTQLTWTLPPGVEAGEIAWPIPKKYPIGNLANYGYSGTVLLPVPLTITPQFKPSLLGGNLEIKLKAQWLICRQECVPEEGEFALKIPARSATALYADVFNASFQAQPRPLSGAGTVRIDGKVLKVSVPGLPAEAQGKVLDSSRRRRR